MQEVKHTLHLRYCESGLKAWLVVYRGSGSRNPNFGTQGSRRDKEMNERTKINIDISAIPNSILIVKGNKCAFILARCESKISCKIYCS